MSRRTPKHLVEAESVLRELKEWARIERSIDLDSPRALAWSAVIGWARGKAFALKLDLDSETKTTTTTKQTPA